MTQEIEAKILNIDILAIEKKLTEIGAKKIGEKFFRIMVFDFPGFPLDQKSSWLRLRDEGDKVTMAFKQRLGIKNKEAGQNDAGMEEFEITVDSFERTKDILLSLGLIEKFSQEKKRISWEKGEIKFDLDTYPQIPSFLEIEGSTWAEVDAAILELGFSLADKKVCSATQIYTLNGIRDKDYIKMTFQEFVKRLE